MCLVEGRTPVEWRGTQRVIDLEFHHVDVFAARPYSGNSLAVFPDGGDLSSADMLAITQELRHFESIFLVPTGRHREVRARVFDLFGELDFAGHPLLGAAGVLHERDGFDGALDWQFVLNRKTVAVRSTPTRTGHRVELDQGIPEFLGGPPLARREEFAKSLDLDLADLQPDLELEVVSTGLRYLIVPIRSGIERAQIVRRDFEELLQGVGAQFVYLLDVGALEGRTWNNDGLTEDVATGSAAGTVGAYLAKHGRIAPDQEFTLQQGRFVGRPSEISVVVHGSPTAITNVRVSGDVAGVGHGRLARPNFA